MVHSAVPLLFSATKRVVENLYAADAVAPAALLDVMVWRSVYRNQDDVLRIVLRLGAEPNLVDSTAGMTPLMNAVPHVPLMRTLLEAGAHLETYDAYYTTALMYALRNMDAMNLLIAWGADVDARDDANETVLMKAAGNRSLECIQRLIEAGARAGLNDRRRTALTVAIENQKDDVVTFLRSLPSS